MPEFGLPRGYVIQNLAGKGRAELEKRADVANNAFGITKHTAETIQTLQKAPTHRPEMDLVVVEPGRTFVAYGVIWFDEANRIGMFGPVGTHPDFVRQGLGKGLMS
jgi:predicted N-acetyltransferase YhbS